MRTLCCRIVAMQHAYENTSKPFNIPLLDTGKFVKILPKHKKYVICVTSIAKLFPQPG
jgi:hypothetical protein